MPISSSRRSGRLAPYLPQKPKDLPINAVLRRQALEKYELDLNQAKSRSEFTIFKAEQNDSHREKYGKTFWRSGEEVYEFKSDNQKVITKYASGI